jgi:endonuclease YncB( thermonuclease family)
MKKRHAFLFSLLITLLIAANIFLFSNFKQTERQTAIITKVIDGDTLLINNETTIRLLNVNTPEKGNEGYEEAKNFLSSYENSIIELEVIGADKYGRTLARIYAPKYLNLELVEKGLATKFLVDESELSKFEKAERNAIEMEVGIWKKSVYFGCLESEINQFEDLVFIKNTCKEIDIENWTIRDESRKNYKFPKLSIGEININTKEGENSETEIFLQNKQDIWNNDRDTLYIFDKKGRIAHHYTYGY